jgi:hypothetical protein
LTGDASVTLQTVTLGDTPNATTGWFTEEITESTIDALIAPKSASTMLLGAGSHMNVDAVGLSSTHVRNGDYLIHCGTRYKIVNLQTAWYPDTTLLVLKRLILGDTPDSKGWFERTYYTDTIEAFIAPKSAMRTLHGLGWNSKTDVVGVSVAPVRSGDVIGGNDPDTYYVASNIQPVYYVGTFIYWTYDLTVVPEGYLP